MWIICKKDKVSLSFTTVLFYASNVNFELIILRRSQNKSRCTYRVDLPCRIELSLSWIGNQALHAYS